MKNVLLLSFLCIVIMSCNTKDKNGVSNAKEAALKVMTYNIRLNTTNDAENAWPNRKDFLASQIKFLNPHVFGVQEALPMQMNDLNSLLPSYKSVGQGRDGEDIGEYSAIFYDSEHIDVEQSSTFWLSTTPNKISKDWDAAYPRICTYGLFKLKNKANKFWVFNTHFDHVGAIARKESAALILEKIKSINTQDYPVIMMGDLNAEPQSDVILDIKKQMIDSKEAATVVFGPNGTFNGFNHENPVNRRIDYVFVSDTSKLTVEKYAVFSSSIDLKFPSDHFPVYIELRLK